MENELLREILTELQATRKLLENAFGVRAESIQQLGVVDRPIGEKKFSISQSTDVMLEQENPDGSWSKSSVKHICGFLSGLEWWNHEYDGKPIVYLTTTINADVPHSIRSNVENTFSRMLISMILGMTNDQLANPITLTVEAGTTKKTVRMPRITDSLGAKLMITAIKDDDWDRNAISYVDQAIAKIKSVQVGGQLLGGVNRVLTAIAPAQTPSTPPSQQSILVQEVIAKAKALWGDSFKDKIREHSATHFEGAFLKDMTAAQLQKYLEDLEEIKYQQKGVA